MKKFKLHKKHNKRNPFCTILKWLGIKGIALIIMTLMFVLCLCLFLITQNNKKVKVEMETSFAEIRIEMND